MFVLAGAKAMLYECCMNTFDTLLSRSTLVSLGLAISPECWQP